ncbi:hsp70 family protein [Gigaspora margarita]|uniref:Hsp70 family protein n=1 Tax=Gigaspora margarita TaxID=4874 RepID=A0A8H3XHR5_GIGMA|nr:hsp70 family protein [Gigaspora margarita]
MEIEENVIHPIAVKIDCNESFLEWFQLDMTLNEVRNYIAEKKNLDPKKLQFKKNKDDILIEHKENDKLSEILDEKNIIYIVDKSKVVINVQIDDRREVHSLGMNENLTNIRKHFKSENISNFIFQKMVNSVENEIKFVNINRRDESEKTLAEVFTNNSLYISATTILVTIYIIDKANEKNNDHLGFERELLKENTLENIRGILEKSSNEAHKMKSNYYFLNKKGIDIARDESNRKLLEILDNIDDTATLKITKTPNLDWNQMIEESTNGFNFKDFKDFTDFSTEKAPNKVFAIHNKEEMTHRSVHKISDKKVEDNNKQDLSCKSNLILDGNISTVLPWISFSTKCSLNVLDQMLKTDSTSKKYSHIKVKMAEIKISKEDIYPTPDFKEDVEKALTNHDKVEALHGVAKKYGPFYALHIVFGGIIENKRFNSERSSEMKNTIDINGKINVGTNIISSTNGINYQSEIANKSSGENSDANFQVTGGKPKEYYQDKDGLKKWMESLENSQLWNIIEYNDIHLIFDLLDDKLQKKINMALGQRILQKNVTSISSKFDKSRVPSIYKLYKELKNIPNIFECQIFTSIMCEKDKDIFSSRVDYIDKYSPIILIHHIISNKEQRDKEKCKDHEIQIGWVIVGYCSNFDFNLPEHNVNIDSGKFDIKINENNPHIVKIPLENAKIYETCLLGTCVLEPPYDPKSTIAVSVHFSQSNNSACLFISDLNNSDESSLAIDKENFLKRLKLFICTIDKCENTRLININWKHDKLQSLISHGTGIDKKRVNKFKYRNCLSKDISNTRQQELPFFASIIFKTCSPDCSYHGFLTIASKKIMYGSLNNEPLKKGTGQITYFVLHKTC